MDKKILTIIILSLIIIGLLFWIFVPGKNRTDGILEQVQSEQIELIRSNGITEKELAISIGESKELEKNNIKLQADIIELSNKNSELTGIFDNITIGSEKTESSLKKYGEINTDFGRFIQENATTE